MVRSPDCSSISEWLQKLVRKWSDLGWISVKRLTMKAAREKEEEEEEEEEGSTLYLDCLET